MNPGDEVWVKAKVVHTDLQDEVRLSVVDGGGVTDDKVYARTRDVYEPAHEHKVFERPVGKLGLPGEYTLVPKGTGATHYVVGDEDLLHLVRQALKVQAIKDYLEHGKSAAVIWEFLNQDKPLPIPSTRKRTKEGRMAFERAWDEMDGPPKEARVNEILKERFNGAPGWEE